MAVKLLIFSVQSNWKNQSWPKIDSYARISLFLILKICSHYKPHVFAQAPQAIQAVRKKKLDKNLDRNGSSPYGLR